MTKFTLLVILLLFGGFSHCGSKKIAETGVITFLKGDVFVTRKEVKSPLKFGEEVIPGDLIETSATSVAIVTFASGESEAEIQSNSKFLIHSYDEKKADLEIQNGSIWFRVNQKGKKDFNLSNPTAVAGVRGTKFFTFQIDSDTFGTCHCEGKVHYTVKENQKASDNDHDYMILVRKGKTITIEPSEFMEMFPGRTSSHEHSEIENSPLGKVRSFTPADRKKLLDRIESKFAALP